MSLAYPEANMLPYFDITRNTDNSSSFSGQGRVNVQLTILALEASSRAFWQKMLNGRHLVSGPGVSFQNLPGKRPLNQLPHSVIDQIASYLQIPEVSPFWLTHVLKENVLLK